MFSFPDYVAPPFWGAAPRRSFPRPTPSGFEGIDNEDDPAAFLHPAELASLRMGPYGQVPHPGVLGGGKRHGTAAPSALTAYDDAVRGSLKPFYASASPQVHRPRASATATAAAAAPAKAHSQRQQACARDARAPTPTVVLMSPAQATGTLRPPSKASAPAAAPAAARLRQPQAQAQHHGGQAYVLLPDGRLLPTSSVVQPSHPALQQHQLPEQPRRWALYPAGYEAVDEGDDDDYYDECGPEDGEEEEEEWEEVRQGEEEEEEEEDHAPGTPEKSAALQRQLQQQPRPQQGPSRADAAGERDILSALLAALAGAPELPTAAPPAPAPGVKPIRKAPVTQPAAVVSPQRPAPQPQRTASQEQLQALLRQLFQQPQPQPQPQSFQQHDEQRRPAAAPTHRSLPKQQPSGPTASAASAPSAPRRIPVKATHLQAQPAQVPISNPAVPAPSGAPAGRTTSPFAAAADAAAAAPAAAAFFNATPAAAAPSAAAAAARAVPLTRTESQQLQRMREAAAAARTRQQQQQQESTAAAFSSAGPQPQQQPAQAQQQQQQQQQQRRQVAMPRSEAVRVVQRWWRGARLRRHDDLFRRLVEVQRDLAEAAACMGRFLAASSGRLTHPQLLEVNELSMRALLALDGLQGIPTEYRPIRRRLTARALALQDQAQEIYARSSLAPTASPPAAPPADAADATAPDADTASQPGSSGDADRAFEADEAPAAAAVPTAAAVPEASTPASSEDQEPEDQQRPQRQEQETLCAAATAGEGKEDEPAAPSAADVTGTSSNTPCTALALPQLTFGTLYALPEEEGPWPDDVTAPFDAAPQQPLKAEEGGWMGQEEGKAGPEGASCGEETEEGPCCSTAESATPPLPVPPPSLATVSPWEGRPAASPSPAAVASALTALAGGSNEDDSGASGAGCSPSPRKTVGAQRQQEEKGQEARRQVVRVVLVYSDEDDGARDVRELRRVTLSDACVQTD